MLKARIQRFPRGVRLLGLCGGLGCFGLKSYCSSHLWTFNAATRVRSQANPQSRNWVASESSSSKMSMLCKFCTDIDFFMLETYEQGGQ